MFYVSITLSSKTFYFTSPLFSFPRTRQEFAVVKVPVLCGVEFPAIPMSRAGRPPLVDCPLLLIPSIRSYTSYLNNNNNNPVYCSSYIYAQICRVSLMK